MTRQSNSVSNVAILLAWALALGAATAFIAYKLHDIREPFAFGHTRWSDAYMYLFARAHLDYGVATTLGLNVEGVTGSGEPIFYLSAPPLGGLMQAMIVASLGGSSWTVRVLPLLSTLLIGGLIAVFVYRQQNAFAAPLSLLIFLGMPLVIKYGSSNEGHQVYAIAAGMAAYLLYLRFLDSRNRKPLILAMGCFSIGLAFNWLAGFMAMMVLLHLWVQPLPMRVKGIATLSAAAILGATVLVLLVQQGVATGKFLYPLTRALERSSVPQGEFIPMDALVGLQFSRYWNYFGPVVALLNLYWLVRRLVPKPNWGPSDTWAVLIWAPGLVYGFLLQHAAYKHDFLMLGFVPGATFMATLGLLSLVEDLDKISVPRINGRWLAFMAAALLMGVHAAVAVRSAQNFERQEALDLDSGGAGVAFHLLEIPADSILAADDSVSIGGRTDTVSGNHYASIHPYLDYLVRRPVRAVDDLDALHDLLCESAQTGVGVVLLTRQAPGDAEDGIPVPETWVKDGFGFDRVRILHLHPPSAC